ncbi:MAG TPA: hypothetical protein VIW03_09110 [Anaeromyxobacter sp.]
MIAAALAVSALLSAAPVAQEDWEPPPYEEESDEGRKRIRLSAWGGDAMASGGSGHASTILGGEAAWAFDALDLGLAGYGYQDLLNARRSWTPVVLLRLTERFQTRRAVEAAFTFGVGAGRPRDWTVWFQVALGVRVNLGPMFLGGELAFEQYDLLRLAAGLGVSF